MNRSPPDGWDEEMERLVEDLYKRERRLIVLFVVVVIVLGVVRLLQ